jgi:predicted DNA-binding transcriptional regulator AlpA
MAADFITAETVAQLVGLVDGPAFLRQRDRLTADHAFPQPMPTAFRPMRWRRVEVEAWVARQGLPKPAVLQIPEGSNVRLLNLARAG